MTDYNRKLLRNFSQREVNKSCFFKLEQSVLVGLECQRLKTFPFNINQCKTKWLLCSSIIVIIVLPIKQIVIKMVVKGLKKFEHFSLEAVI